MMLPLSRYRMLDLSRQMPGPFCSALIADMGMDVLVIVNPGDPLGAGLPLIMRNKRSMTLNLKTEEGRKILHRLAAEADVVLEGARPGVMKRLGADYETLRELNPRLVYCSISGYGPDGPFAHRVGHDANYLAYAGVLNHIGQSGGPPVIPDVQFADCGGGGLMAVVGILTALLARAETGRGQLVDVSMLDGSFAFAAYPLLLKHTLGREPERGYGQPTGYFACYGVYETKDGRHLTIGNYEEHFWANLCRHFGREEFIPWQWDETHREEMRAFFRARFREKTLAEWTRELEPIEMCYAPVDDFEGVFANPQLLHRGMIVEIDTPLGPMKTFGPPVKLSDTPASIRSGAPRLGEHTDSVLADLGFSAGEIAELRDKHVV
jgi:crotonobetainyl-CoA:carnitine CoA-transferase CaiB-like acyl-CoA transferase